MGLFDALFGSPKEKKTKQKKPSTTAPEQQQAAVPLTSAQGVPPEVLAVISASLGAVMEGESDPAVVAAVTAAIHHARGGGLALRLRRQDKTWSNTGRQKLMDSRLV